MLSFLLSLMPEAAEAGAALAVFGGRPGGALVEGTAHVRAGGEARAPGAQAPCKDVDDLHRSFWCVRHWMRSDSREATCRVCDGRCCFIRSVSTLPVPPCAHTELRAGEMTEGGGLAVFTLISSVTSLHLCGSVGVRRCVRIVHSSIRSFSRRQVSVECSVTCQELC